MDNKIVVWSIAIAITALPIFAWLYFLFRKSESRRGMIAWVFFLGILTVLPLLAIQYSWKFFPELNVATAVPKAIKGYYTSQFATFVIFAMMEEIFKQWLLRFADKKWLIVKTVNDSIRFSMIAALGFSFAENIYPYFFGLLQSENYKELIGAYFFRSLFTSAAHIFFSGIFGYYYGMSKFVANYRDEAQWQGKKLYFARFMCKIFNIPQDLAFREQKILQGLVIAMGLHGIYNTFLQFGKIIPSLVIVVIGFAYLMILLQRNSGQLNMIIDLSTQKTSTMSKKDEDVVMEIMGQWFNQKKYTDVINMCDRLLEKDPDNNLVKLFREKTADALKGTDLYHEATEIIGTRKQVEDKSTLDTMKSANPEGQSLPTNFKDSEAFQKFLEEEKKKKDEAETFKLDASGGGPIINKNN